MLSVVLQGPVAKQTPEYIERYRAFPFVKEIILSTWKGENVDECNPDTIILNTLPKNKGKGNRNCQIVSSYAGIVHASCNLVIKIRADMFLPYLTEMISFYEKEGREKNIFSLSLYPNFPFHPRDHVFFRTKKICSAFI
jgi:hypothetical protein